MKCYLLLRDNVETGPYDLAEISTQKLLPTDLIWVEGSSHSWRFPAEIAELAHLVQHQQPDLSTKGKTDVSVQTFETKNVFVALPPQPVTTPVEKATPSAEESELETHIAQPLEVLQEKLQKHRQQHQFSFAARHKQNSLLWMAALFVSIFAGAFLIKKMVDAAGANEAGAMVNAALPAKGYGHGAQKEAASYRNALTTEVVPVDTTTEKPKVVKKKVALKKQVSLTASEFKKGVFGGINDLELKVRNRSDQHLDKVAIEVKYLKPNGDVIKTENYSIKAVAPKSTKNLVIPPSKRGVDIKYRITNIKAAEEKASTRDI